MKELSLYETRVLGVLIEKERTTPDQYPLSLNALTTGCNQKSNREPVLSISEAEVQDTVSALIDKGLVAEVVVGSRVTKYRQRFGATEFSEYKVSQKELALLCVLFLRGPQTPGELRTRTNRLADFSGVDDVEATLNDLANRSGDPYLVKMPREPGKRESRYAHLFSGEPDLTMIADQSSLAGQGLPSVNNGEQASGLQHEERISLLESQVAELKADVEHLTQLLDELTS